MRHCLSTAGFIVGLTLGFANIAPAADYTDLSNDELVQMRSKARELAPEERDSYRTEMQNRIQSMSSTERALFRDMNELGNQDNGNGQRKRKGEGDGSGNKHRRGQSNSSGSDGTSRYGQSESKEYGSGYGTRQGGGRHGR